MTHPVSLCGQNLAHTYIESRDREYLYKQFGGENRIHVSTKKYVPPMYGSISLPEIVARARRDEREHTLHYSSKSREVFCGLERNVTR